MAGDGGVTALGGVGSYRGVLEFAPTAFKGLSVVNAVGLDDYLQGVVPAESPASWPAEALKAQAIAARTYAITTAKSADFDHYADTRSQVYKGVGIETASTNAAVAATRGQIVTYNGQPVVTYFFSTSGGKTEDVENTTLGNEPKPWLKSVEDEYDSVSPRHRWTTKLTMKSASRKLGSLVKGSFKGIRVTRRGASPRIMAAEVVGSRGTTTIDGATLRAKLGLFDTWAYFTAISGEKAPARRAGLRRLGRRDDPAALSTVLTKKKPAPSCLSAAELGRRYSSPVASSTSSVILLCCVLFDQRVDLHADLGAAADLSNRPSSAASFGPNSFADRVGHVEVRGGAGLADVAHLRDQRALEAAPPRVGKTRNGVSPPSRSKPQQHYGGCSSSFPLTAVEPAKVSREGRFLDQRPGGLARLSWR